MSGGSPAGHPAASAPGSERGSGRSSKIIDSATDLAVAGFAIWTVWFHLGLLIGWNRVFSIGGCIVTMAAGYPWWRKTPARHRLSDLPDATVGRRRRWSVVCIGATIASFAFGMWPLFWALAIAALVLAFQDRPATPRSPSLVHHDGAMLVLSFGVALAVFSAMYVDWSFDNSYYVDRAIALRDLPWPVGVDTLHSDGLYPSVAPENDLGSLEGAVGTVASLTGWHPLSVYAFLVHPGALLLATIALWRAGRTLGMARPALVSITGMAAMLILSDSGTVDAPGFDRAASVLFASRTGRTILVALVPLVVAYVVEAMGESPGRSRVMLGAAVITAAGVTLMAIPVMAVVLVAAVVTVGGSHPLRAIVLRLRAPLLVASGYLALLAVAAMAMARLVADGGVDAEVIPGSEIAGRALGAPPTGAALAALLLSAPLVVRSGVARRYLVAAPLATLVLAVNPVILWLAGSTILGRSSPRLVWSVPLALVVGVVAADLWERFADVRGGYAAVALLAGLALVTALPDAVAIAVPRWDVREFQFAAAQRLVDAAPGGTAVVASEAVARFVPLVGGDVHPVAVTAFYTQKLGEMAPEVDAAERLWLMEAVTSGIAPGDAARFGAALTRFRVGAVCVDFGALDGAVRAGLRSSGFARDGRVGPCVIWVRQPAT